MNTWSLQPEAPSTAQAPAIPVVEEKKSTPINYASHSKSLWNTRNVWWVNYAMHAETLDDSIVNVWWVNYAKYAWRTNARSQVQDIIISPEYSPDQLQKIIELLGVLEISKTLLPEIVAWARQRGSGAADALQTWAAVAIKKWVQDRLAKNKSPDGKSSLPMKAAWLLVKNAELILELYNGKEMVTKSDPLKLSTGNKAKVFARHGLDGLLSRLGVVWQAADFFFNSSLKSIWALEDQINKHKETLRTYYNIPELYIEEPNKWLEYYKNLQLKQYQG